MKQNILFTCAGRRNYLINYFKKELGGNGKIIAADNHLLAPALIDADIAVRVPDISDKSYISALKEIVKIYRVTAIISLNDLELPILSKYKTELEQEGAKVIVSSEEVIAIGFDKWKTFNFIKEIGLNTPKTYINLKNAIKAIEKGELHFPLVIKPRWGSGSIGIEFPESIEELKLSYKLQKIKLQKSLLSKVSDEDIELSILIQEKLDGLEYGMDVVNNFEGNYFDTFVREKLSMRSGETDQAVSIIDERFENIGKTIGDNLKHIGNMDCDVFLVKNKLYILELNPRFGGGYPFSHEAGANIVATYLGWLNGSSNSEVLKHNNYKQGITFSKCDRLLKISDQSQKSNLFVNRVKTDSDIKTYHGIINKLQCDNPYYKVRVINSFLNHENDKFYYFVYTKNNIPIIIMPFYFREIYINGELTSYFDVCSPYGYSGPFYNDNLQKECLFEFWSEVDEWYANNNVVSEFIRFRLKENHHFYSGKLIPTLTNVKGCILEEKLQWKGFKQKVRNNYRKAIKNNLKVTIANKEKINEDIILTFFNIYTSTMKRKNASKQYLYPLSYFKKFIKENINKCVIVMIYKEDIAISTELILLSNDTIYSFLGGTLEDYFCVRPNDFLKIEVMKWAHKHNIKYYVLGGGFNDDDNLYKYKKSFFPYDKDIIFYTGKKIINKTVYAKLLKKKSQKKIAVTKEISFNNYFPQYRDPD
jgi:carbamoyl-phosphate synthase large subunit